MKKISLIFCSSLLFLACNNATQATKEQHTEMKAGEAAANNPHAKVDPVCDMVEGDMAYTDFSVQGSDTTWFCSPHCKEQFDKDPAQYAKK
jgi:YHS domain-containing protein